MTIIKRELQRGLELSEGIMVGKRPWSDLFVKHTFFTTGYKYYISVVSASKTKEAHKTWSGYVESKVRMLVQKLEQHQSIALAHAFNKGYDRRHHCHNDSEIEQVQEGSLDFVASDDGSNEPVVKPEHREDGEPKVKLESKEGDESPVKDDTQEDGALTLNQLPGADGESKVTSDFQEHGTDVANNGVTEVFTTTHYIGIELVGGMFVPLGDSVKKKSRI